jgi:hypothetical protein
LGCNTFVHENNARNLSVQLSLPQLAKCFVFLIFAYVFSSTKLEKKAEQFCLEARRGEGEKEGAGCRGEKWPKQCMCI